MFALQERNLGPAMPQDEQRHTVIAVISLGSTENSALNITVGIAGHGVTTILGRSWLKMVEVC